MKAQKLGSYLSNRKSVNLKLGPKYCAFVIFDLSILSGQKLI